MEKKLVKDLVDNDLVYVVFKDPDTVIECNIKISFDVEKWRSPAGYYTNAFRGTIYSGENKMVKGDYQDFQVFRVGTAGIWDKELAEKNNITEAVLHRYYPCVPGSVPLKEWENYYNSTHFTVYEGFEVFTNLDDAKEYIVDRKLQSIKNDMLKLIKVKKYKEKQ